LGYVGDPGRTAERFVVHPGTGERLYRTGDVGRYRPDGTIELLGREDLQVKIRGHRIELAEVEAALQCHPRVAHAAVLVDGEAPLSQRLVAFVETARRADGDRGADGAVDDLAHAARAAGQVELAGVHAERYLEYARALDEAALPAMVGALQSSGL